MRRRLNVLRLALLAALPSVGLAGCTPAAPPANLPVSTSTTSACLLASDPPPAKLVRYAAGPTGSTWWVTYTVLRNPCPNGAVVTGIDAAGPVSADDLEFTGESAIRKHHDGDVPFALFPGTDPGGASLDGFALAPGEAVEVIAKVRLKGDPSVPHRVPPLVVQITDGGGPDGVDAGPNLSICTCDPP